jgi:hypothetical protein
MCNGYFEIKVNKIEKINKIGLNCAVMHHSDDESIP